MSLRVMTWAWSVQLPPGPKLVLMALADEADDDGYCFPSHRRLADKCSIAQRTVRRVLCQLEGDGYLRVEARYRGDRSRTSNGYRLASLNPPAKLTRGEGPRDQAPRTPLTRGEGPDVRPLPTTYPPSNPSQPQPAAATECENGPQRGLGSGCDWEFPKALSAGQIGAIREVLKDIRPNQVQDILDELAGRLNVGRVTNPIRYCAALVERAKRGQFTPELGIPVAEARAARVLQLERESAYRHSDPTAVETTLERLPDDLRAPLERMRRRLQEAPSDAQSGSQTEVTS